MNATHIRHDIIAIGAPIGGGAALAYLVTHFPPDLEAAVFVVLHATPENPILLADILNAPGRMRAAPAMNGEAIVPRRIYVAADGRHLLIRDGKVYLSDNELEYPHRPSIDLLFTSVAAAFRERVLGVLLLHAREDGANGLQAIREAGGHTISHRNEAMPDELRHPATGQALAHHHIKLEEIGPRVLACVSRTTESV
ncbi:MAG TPA: chemotaxis protein CheB [Chthoniobacterales bacterium]|jgi:two-component system chemotaxis response regulator CheB